MLFSAILATVSIVCAACSETNDNAKYIISFNTDGGSAVDSIVLNAGDSLVLPDPPVKEGYVFTGWYSDRACTRPVNVSLFKARSNTTIFAGWESVETYPHAVYIGEYSEGTVTLYEPQQPAASMGDEVSVRVVPFSEYEIVEVYASGRNDGTKIIAAPNSAGSVFTFSMPAQPVDVCVIFELKSFGISVSDATVNGSVVLSKTSAKSGDTVSLQFIADFGYKFSAAYLVTSDGINTPVSGNSFVMPAGDVSVKAVFEEIDYDEVFSVHASAGAGGSIITYSEYAAEGEYVYFSVDVTDGYLLDKVLLSYSDVVIELEERLFLMPASDVELTASFREAGENETTYKVNVSGDLHGFVALTSPDNEFIPGEKVSLYIAPESGYVAAGVSVNGNYVDGNSFFMPACDVTVSVDFRFLGYKVEFSSKYSGYTVYGAPEYALPGSRVTFELSLADGCGIKEVTLIYDKSDSKTALVPVDGSLTKYSFVMGNEDAIVEVCMVAGNTYLISVEECEGGLITVSPSAAISGAIIDVAFEPEAGYRYKDGSFSATYVSVGGESLNAVTGAGRFVMPGANVVLRAEFERVYDIRGLESEGFTILPSVSSAAPGETVTFTVDVHDADIVADSIYLTLTVSGIGNVDIGYEYSYTLPAFTEAVGGTVSVNVPEYYEDVNAAASYYFNIEITGNGTVSANYFSGARIPAGKEIRLVISPAEGYYPESLTLEYGSVSEEVGDVFVMPEAPSGATLKVVFGELQAANVTPENLYSLRRDEFFEAGIKLSIYRSAAGFSDIWLGYPLLGYVTGALKAESEYGFPFVLLHVDTLEKVAPIASTAFKIISTEYPDKDVDVHIDHNSVVLAVEGDAAEAYSMLLNGVRVYENMILYTRADFSYGLYAVVDSPEYLIVPDCLDNRSVTYVARGALRSADSLKALIMKGVREIADFAFEDMDTLMYLDLGFVEKIGRGAFKGCASLQRFFVADGNSYFFTDSRGALYADLTGSSTAVVAYPAGNASSEYTTYSGTVAIYDYAFYGAVFLEKLSYLTTLVEIGDYAFYGAERLSIVCYSNVAVGLGAGTADFEQSQSRVESIGDHAFNGTALSVFRFGKIRYLGTGAVSWDGIKDTVVYLNVSSVVKTAGTPVILPETASATLKIVVGTKLDDYIACEDFAYLKDYLYSR